MKRASRSNGTRMGGVVPLSQIQTAAPLIPKYGPKADLKLTSRNSLEFSRSEERRVGKECSS